MPAFPLRNHASASRTILLLLPHMQAQPLNELYGVMDPVTRDWTDGVLSKLFR